MKNFLNKIFKRTINLSYINQDFKELNSKTPTTKIFKIINNFSSKSEIRYVGGCVRKIINKEKVDDIDLATNLNPQEVLEAFKNTDIKFFKTGIDHGTITAIIDDYKFEITSLREDIKTDGRHAEVKFSSDWKKDALRRDFTFNSIYADLEGNLFDPFDGKEDLKKGLVKFVGTPEKRIREDYLRILRYLRFYLNYSKFEHNPEIIKVIKKNLSGISNLSKERLLDELKKYIKSNILTKLSNDKSSLELFEFIFPQLKNIKFFSKPNLFAKIKLKESDFIFLLSILIIDGTDNADYFMYKFNLSKKDQKRLKVINNFFSEKISIKSFSKNNLNKLFYFHGKQAVMDVLGYKLFISKNPEKDLLDKLETFKSKDLPIMPVQANELMEKYNIPAGKTLGNILKMLEEEWVKNDFELSETIINKIIKR
jgi:poly(A) polymerase